MKNLYFLLAPLFCLSLFFTSQQDLKASHIMGGQLSYQHLGGDDYRITLQLWRDCCDNCSDFAPAPLPTDMPFWIRDEMGNAYNEVGSIINSSVNVPITTQAIQFEIEDLEETLCISELTDVCVEIGIYRFDITLPSTSGVYEVSSQICCRNSTIININSPDSFGATYAIDIPHNTLTDNNNSAVFIEFPPGIICSDNLLVFDHSAFDADGDSLVYGLYTPFNDGVWPDYGTVLWANGFDVDNQLGGNPSMTIDSATGLLTANPDTPGQYVVGVFVEEWRDGELISTNRRDFQFNITECEQVEVMVGVEQEGIGLTGPGEYEINSCSSLTYVFEDIVLGEDSDPNDVEWLGLDDIPGLFFNNSLDIVNPQISFPGNGSYEIQLLTNAGECGEDTTTFTFNMFVPSASFGYSIEENETEVQFTSGESLSAYIDSITWDFGDPFANAEDNQSTELNPAHNYTEEGTYVVTQTIYTLDCIGEIIDSIVIGMVDTMNVDTMGMSLQTITENLYDAIHLYPNPTTGNRLYLSNLEALKGKTIELVIYNVLGQVVETSTLSNAFNITETIDLSGYKEGMYWLSLYDSKSQIKTFSFTVIR